MWHWLTLPGMINGQAPEMERVLQCVYTYSVSICPTITSQLSLFLRLWPVNSVSVPQSAQSLSPTVTSPLSVFVELEPVHSVSLYQYVEVI